MKIIIAPHPTLRQKAIAVSEVTPELKNFIKKLSATMDIAEDPKGVGLAANQVNKAISIFVARNNPDSPTQVFINPEIIKTSKVKELGTDKKNPRYEGCLSIPELYGPVYRYRWVDLTYAEIQHNKLVNKKERFIGFYARVIQHELDHLNGILFTDYALNSDLPIFKEEGEKLVEVQDKSLLSLL